VSGLRVIKAGLLTQIEDLGRVGYGDIGITQSGVADAYSGAWANRLLFNAPNAPLLEILLGGVLLEAETDTMISLTGADAKLRIGGRECPLWRSHHVRKGEQIEIGMSKRALRLYLAVKGGFACEQNLGSCAVTLKEGMGRKVEQGDLLSCQSSKPLPQTATPQTLIPKHLDVLTLRVVLGYQSDLFAPSQRADFFSSPYSVTQATDRMGCRLKGESVQYEGGELISEPIAYGSIQIPSDGQPIVLLNERQTIGGYPKIGSVIPIDCYRLAQAKPGTTVAFREIGLEEGRKVTRAVLAFIMYSSDKILE